MNIKKLFAAPGHPLFADIALFLIRLTAGLAFMIHGWGKIRNPLGWMGPDSSMPRVFQALAAISEFGGGMAWILGLLTPLASLGILCTMAVASHSVAIKHGAPFVSLTGGLSYELSLVYLAVAFVLLALGPGRFSLDRKLFGRR